MMYAGSLEDVNYLIDVAEHNRFMSDAFEKSYMLNAKGMEISQAPDGRINNERARYKALCEKYDNVNKEAEETQSCISWFQQKFASLCNLLSNKIAGLLKNFQSLINAFLGPITDFMKLLSGPIKKTTNTISKVANGEFVYIPELATTISKCMNKLDSIFKQLTSDSDKMDKKAEEAEQVSNEVNKRRHS